MKTTNKILLFLLIWIVAYGLIIFNLNQKILVLEEQSTAIIIIEEKEKNEGVIKEEKYPITEDERELVTRIVIAESRGEPLEGQIAVAQVILDRWIKQGGSLSEVILAPKQFATPYAGSIVEYPDCGIATHLVFDLGFRVFKEPTLFFFNPITSEPSQVELLRTYSLRGSIGNHEFRGVD